MDNEDNSGAARAELDTEQKELEDVNDAHSLDKAQLSPADGQETIVSASIPEQEAQGYSQDLGDLHADGFEPQATGDAASEEQTAEAALDTGGQEVTTEAAPAFADSIEGTEAHSLAESAATAEQLPQPVDHMATEDSPSVTQEAVASDSETQQGAGDIQASEPDVSPAAAVDKEAEAAPAADAHDAAPAVEPAVAGQSSDMPELTRTDSATKHNPDQQREDPAASVSKRNSRHSTSGPDHTMPQDAAVLEPAMPDPVEHTVPSSAPVPAPAPALHDVQEHAASPLSSPAVSPTAPEALEKPGELTVTLTKTVNSHKETQLERLTAPTAMRMLKTLQQTQGNKTEWHIATGVLFKSKKLNADEMTAMVDRLCVAKHAEDNLPPKPHAVKLVYVDNKETYEPVKEVTKDENIAYMAELYSRCQETRTKTQQQLAEKYLQPLIKPREKSSSPTKKA